MIKLEPSIPYLSNEEKEAFSHNPAVITALKTLRSYGFNVSYEGVNAPKWPNDAEFEKAFPGMGMMAGLNELSQSN